MSVVRLVRSVGTLSLAAMLALPLWSVLARPDVPLGLKLVVAILWGTTALRPVLGVQAFVVTLPLALGVYALFPGLSPTAVSECPGVVVRLGGRAPIHVVRAGPT